MADKYFNLTDLSYFWNRLKSYFASASDLQDLAGEVDDIIAEGGEPNVIETISKNGTNVPPVGKNVDLDIPTTVAELSDASDYAQVTDIPTKTSDLTNDGDGTQGSAFATEEYVDENGGKIDTISVNNSQRPIVNKNVDITVPTAVSDLTNDSGFQTQSEVDARIEAKVGAVYHPKGSVATYADLPTSTAEEGDVYNVVATGMNYAFTSSGTWDELGMDIDLTPYMLKADMVAITTAEIDDIMDDSE